MKWRKALGFQIILDILIALWWDCVHCLKSFVIELHGFKLLHLYWILFTTMLNFSTYCGYFNCQHKILAVLNWFYEILIKFKDLWHYPRDCMNEMWHLIWKSFGKETVKHLTDTIQCRYRKTLIKSISMPWRV